MTDRLHAIAATILRRAGWDLCDLIDTLEIEHGAMVTLRIAPEPCATFALGGIIATAPGRRAAAIAWARQIIERSPATCCHAIAPEHCAEVPPHACARVTRERVITDTDGRAVAWIKEAANV